MDELLGEFIAETRETLETIAGEIVAWEADPADKARLDTVFRFVHTVKGSCGFLDLQHLQRISHEAETALSDLRSGHREPTPHLVSAILAIVDRIGSIADALESGEPIDESGDDALIAALHGKPEPASAAISEPEPSEQRSPARSIRVPVDLLDRLMNGVSDLVLARNELSRQLRRAGGDHLVDTAFERMSGCVADMRDAITWTRMQRIESLFAALPRLVRDLSAELGKTVALDIEGADVELDREMIEMLRDPLTHIVRNALDHGIEPAEERRAAGKPERGRLSIGARQSGNQIRITIGDDGRGIDRQALIDKAVEAELIEPGAAERLDEAAALDLIFHPGLSTAESVSNISGRGVGMDVVRANVEHIGGSIAIESETGSGTTLALSVPLTLTIIPALIVGSGDGQYAIPRSAIEEIVSVDRGRAVIERVGGTDIAQVRGVRLACVGLAALFGAPDRRGEESASGHLVIVRSSRQERYGIVVDAVFDHEELVVKPAAPCVMASGVYAGTALPDNGRPILLLDVAGIASAAGLRLNMADREALEGRKAIERPSRSDALIFEDLDGRRRAVRMGVVERILDADVAQIAESAGALRLTWEDRTMPVAASGPLPDSGSIRILRMSDGTREIAYAICPGAADIIAWPDEFEPAKETGRIAGVAVIGGEAVELLDPYYLLSELGSGRADDGERPLCLVVGGEERWRSELLGPLIAAAGYRLSFDEADRAAAAVIIDAADRDEPVETRDSNVVRLTSQPEAGDGSVYRYDRQAIFAAIDAKCRAGG